jgi:hypothetical protein
LSSSQAYNPPVLVKALIPLPLLPIMSTDLNEFPMLSLGV